MGVDYAVTVGLVIIGTGLLTGLLASQSRQVTRALPRVALPAALIVGGTVLSRVVYLLYGAGAEGSFAGPAHARSAAPLAVVGAVAGFFFVALATGRVTLSITSLMPPLPDDEGTGDEPDVPPDAPDDVDPDADADEGADEGADDADDADDGADDGGRGWPTACALLGLALSLAAAAPQPLFGFGGEARYLLPLNAAGAFSVALAVFVFAEWTPVECALGAVGVGIVGGSLALLVSWSYEHAHGEQVAGVLGGLAAGLLVAVVVEAIVDATVSASRPFPLVELGIGLALLGLAHFGAGLATPDRPSFLFDRVGRSVNQRPAPQPAVRIVCPRPAGNPARTGLRQCHYVPAIPVPTTRP